MELKICEIYHSIQGESSFAGLPCVFIRVSGCSLRCSWCDTRYAFSEGQSLSLRSILDQVESFGCKLVEFTGGEPLEQREVYSLMKELITRGYTVLVETGGHMDISHIPEEAHIIMDVKCPGSGMCARNHAANLTGLSHKDEVKFVLSDEADFYWACEQVRNHALCERTQVLFSCVSGKIEPVWVAEQILKTGLNIRFQLQLHKILWDPSRRSV